MAFRAFQTRQDFVIPRRAIRHAFVYIPHLVVCRAVGVNFAPRASVVSRTIAQRASILASNAVLCVGRICIVAIGAHQQALVGRPMEIVPHCAPVAAVAVFGRN